MIGSWSKRARAFAIGKRDQRTLIDELDCFRIKGPLLKAVEELIQ